MMANICNRLQKHVPPPFVTVKTTNSRSALSNWSKLQKKSNYARDVELLSYEMDFLSGFIVRKGQQLRLEKALLLTNQILKVGQRWRANELLQQTREFETGFGTNKNSGTRRPSRQWGTWILYLMLREAALLAKVKLECENATQYWLGLISKSHHWGDSLVITGILSRIWHLSSNIVHEMINVSYPAILELSRLLEPTGSSKWPSEDWDIPEDLYLWLRDSMKLSFERARLNVNLSCLKTNVSISGNAVFSILSKSYESKETKVEEGKGHGASHTEIDNPVFYIDKEGTESFTSFSQDAEEEDFGEVMEDEVKPRVRVKERKLKNNQLLQQYRNDPHNPKVFEAYWGKFIKNCSKETSSPKKRKMLSARLKMYKLNEKDGCPIIYKKLCVLLKLTKISTKDNTTKCSGSGIRKKLKIFNRYIKERTENVERETNLRRFKE